MGRPDAETAALVALLRNARRPVTHYSELVEAAGSAHAVLEDEQGLLAEELTAAAAADLAGWTAHGMRVLTVLEHDYPENLRAVYDRPPLIFVAGRLTAADARAVAVIGSRRASPAGIERAQMIANELIDSGYTVVSGLARGIDTAAHSTALDRRARTIAVIGTGLARAYPSENAPLQSRIAEAGAVISQFWPEAGPTREAFPARNAVMSGVSLATVIVEATKRSGARIQARHSLRQGRPVLLTAELLDQAWACELAGRSGVHVIGSAPEVTAVIERVSSTELPVP